MELEILATESLGVRGMCCFVTAGDRRILIDPGIALGYWRHHLLPHPCQIAVGVKIREAIIGALKSATEIVFSHFHGDHVPLLRANPYQLAFRQLPPHFGQLPCWSKSRDSLSSHMIQRAEDLEELLGPNMKVAENLSVGPLSFSQSVPHGAPDGRFGTVMMTRVAMQGQVFVHASDIQLLDDATVDTILAWEPDIVFTAGPPLYIEMLDDRLKDRAWENGLRLAKNVSTLIVDHHLLRSRQGGNWLHRLSETLGKKVYCAADFMHQPRRLLEARREELYAALPVPPHWHEEYEKGRIAVLADFDSCDVLLEQLSSNDDFPA